MKKIKHSKFKNTGILFELLVRQITTDTLNNVQESQAGNIIRTYFHKNSPLSKELSLYQTLVKEKFNSDTKAESLIEACLSARKKLNNSTLTREKYNLIKSIKETWDLDEFFSSRVSNYKVLASIYKIFEYKLEENPKQLVETKYTLVEHITFNKQKENVEPTEVLSEDKEIRNLTYKLLVDKFNSKYKGLDTRQKKLLENFILNVSNTNNLKEYFSFECLKVSKQLSELNESVTDQATKIKINESVNLLKNMNQGKTVKDEEVLAMLRYYELVKELKKTIN